MILNDYAKSSMIDRQWDKFISLITGSQELTGRCRGRIISNRDYVSKLGGVLP